MTQVHILILLGGIAVVVFGCALIIGIWNFTGSRGEKLRRQLDETLQRTKAERQMYREKKK